MGSMDPQYIDQTLTFAFRVDTQKINSCLEILLSESE